MAQRISVLGLGNMGTALARTVLSLSGRVTVWNRTPAKAATLVAAGATLAASAEEAVAASDVFVVCVGNYDQTNHMLSPCADLSGKTLLQLSSGTPEEAAEAKTRGQVSTCGLLQRLAEQRHGADAGRAAHAQRSAVSQQCGERDIARS